jgi:hypothetical protein
VDHFLTGRISRPAPIANISKESAMKIATKLIAVLLLAGFLGGCAGFNLQPSTSTPDSFPAEQHAD